MKIKATIQEIKKTVLNHKIKFGIGVGLLVLFCAIPLGFLVFGSANIDPSVLSPYSRIVSEEDRIYISINSEDGYIFKSSMTGEGAVKDFLKSNQAYAPNKNILPKNFDKNSSFTRTTKSNGIKGELEHYFITQTMDGIQVYGSSLVVHLKNSSEVYSVSGNLTLNSVYEKEKLTTEEVKNIALKHVEKEAGTSNLKITEEKKYIFNKKLLDLPGDSTNYASLGMSITSFDPNVLFSQFIIVSLVDGEVLFVEEKIHDALQRTIKNCVNNVCSPVRQEGGPASNVADANRAYDLFSDVYAYFKQNFSRVSFDGNDSPYIGNVNYNFGGLNASWVGAHKAMYFSPGLVVRDITWHELAHAVTEYTAKLVYKAQAGALNEGVSDIFGSASDENWSIGEEVSDPRFPIRSMSNPPLKNDPDRLFSPLYHCKGTDTMKCDDKSTDYCGVHVNSGVINKTFYLMSAGGSFNNCTMKGVGPEVSRKIIYSVLDNHLNSTSNFYDMYSAIQKACGELYGASSETCIEVVKAAQATELDQQAPGSQAGPMCRGISAKPASCSPQAAPTATPVGSSPNTPTATPIGSNPNSPTATPTLAPGAPTNAPTLTPTPPINKNPIISVTPTPTPIQYFTCKPDDSCIKSGKSIQLCPLVCKPQ